MSKTGKLDFTKVRPKNKKPTEDEIERAAFIAERTARVAALKVKVDEMEFDGDETSQNRMARSIVGMSDTDTLPWTLADNTTVQVTKAQLTQALRLSGLAQAEVWAMPD